VRNNSDSTHLRNLAKKGLARIGGTADINLTAEKLPEAYQKAMTQTNSSNETPFKIRHNKDHNSVNQIVEFHQVNPLPVSTMSKDEKLALIDDVRGTLNFLQELSNDPVWQKVMGKEYQQQLSFHSTESPKNGSPGDNQGETSRLADSLKTLKDVVNKENSSPELEASLVKQVVYDLQAVETVANDAYKDNHKPFWQHLGNWANSSAKYVWSSFRSEKKKIVDEHKNTAKEHWNKFTQSTIRLSTPSKEQVSDTNLKLGFVSHQVKRHQDNSNKWQKLIKAQRAGSNQQTKM
jgi:hypothetical protein